MDKKNNFYLILDAIFSFVWIIIYNAGKFTGKTGSALAKGIAAGWKRMGSGEPRHKGWVFFNGLFRGCGLLLKIIFYLPLLLFSQLVRQLNDSPLMRRWFFAVALPLFLLIWFSPPWHWGRWYWFEDGKASWYGPGFYFRRTAGMEWFLPGLFYSAAHRTLPLGTYVLVINQENGRRIVLRINDRGPFVPERIIDLSWAAAIQMGIYRDGTAEVKIYTRKCYGAGIDSTFYFPFIR